MKTIPHPTWKDWLFLLRKDAPHQLLSLATKYGNIVKLKSATLLVSDPNIIDHIMKKNVDNYSKDVREYHRLSALFADGLLTTMGPAWSDQRRAIQSLFNTQKIHELVTETVSLTQNMLDRWEWFAKHNEPIEMVAEMLALVLQISMRFLFSETISTEHAKNLAQQFTIAQRCMLSALTLNPKIPTPDNYLFHWHKQRIQQYTKKLIAKRRRLPVSEWPTDLLSLLLNMRKDPGQQPLNESTLIGEMITFMGTGHETTGNGLAWTLFCLAKHPDFCEEVSAEAANLTSPTLDDLKNFPFSKQVIQEGLRLYPPIWSFARHTVADDSIDNLNIAAGTEIVMSPFVIHRLPSVWEHPEIFNPQRFAQTPARLSYIPFGMGPHICIASTFATIKMQLITSLILQRFRLELLPEYWHIPLEPLISLRPAKPMRFRIHKHA